MRRAAGASARDRHDARRRAVGHRVGDDVAERPRRGGPDPPRPIVPAGTVDVETGRPFAADAVERERDLGDRHAEVDRGRLAPGAGPPRRARGRRCRRRRPRARRPPSEPPRDRRGRSGTTPSIIAWSCDSRTVAGVARSWAMSLAARRRSISERSRRSAIALNASASSVDSRSSPPVARARGLARTRAVGPRRPRRGAAASAGPAIDAEASAMTRTLTSPATSSVTLNSGRNPRSPACAGRLGLERRDDLAVELDRCGVVGDVAVGRPAEGGQRGAVGRRSPDLAAEVVGEPAARSPGRGRGRSGGQPVGEGRPPRHRAVAAAGWSGRSRSRR